MAKYLLILLLSLLALPNYSQTHGTQEVFRDTVIFDIPQGFGTKPHYLFGFPMGYEYLYKSKCYSMWDKRLEEVTFIFTNKDSVKQDLVLEIINPIIYIECSSTNNLKTLQSQINYSKGFILEAKDTQTITFKITKGKARDGYKVFLWDKNTFALQGKVDAAEISVFYTIFILSLLLLTVYILLFRVEKNVYWWYVATLFSCLVLYTFYLGIVKFLLFTTQNIYAPFYGESIAALLYSLCIYSAAKFYPIFINSIVNKIFIVFRRGIIVITIWGVFSFIISSDYQVHYTYPLFLMTVTAMGELIFSLTVIYYWREIRKNPVNKWFSIIAVIRILSDCLCNLKYIGFLPISKEIHDTYLIMPSSFHMEIFHIITFTIELFYVFFMLIYQTWYVERGETLMKLAREKENNYLSFINGIEEERQRISNELHNSFQLNLSLIRDKLLTYKKLVEEGAKDSEKTFQHILGEVVKSQEELRMLVADLDTKEIEKYGLITALHNLQSRCKTPQFSLHLNTNSDFREISTTNQIHIYRMIQIALHNVMKHAEAKACYLQLLADETDFHLSIEDDGKGFDLQNTPKRFGLRNIKDRAAMLGGTFMIESQPQQGTILFIRLPLTNLIATAQ